MTEPNDGCIKSTGRSVTASGTPISKEAGISLYLMEELGDARLHCAQLSHYLDLARQIVEKSKAKDHIYEVAGHLLQAIPEHLFKLEKSLQAVALAADRMDYEEIKQELKPDKVQELERVLKEVRIRTVPHRSEPRQPMNPKQAAESLQAIADGIRSTGKVPVVQVASLIAQLEGQDRTASDSTAVAALFEEMGKSLLQPSVEAPSRLQLASSIRKALSACMDACDLSMANGLPTSPDEQEARRSRFEKGQPADPTQNMNPEDKKKWEDSNEEHKDNFKEAALDPGPMPRMELMKSDMMVAYRRGTAGNWKYALVSLIEVVENLGFLLKELGGGTDGMAKATLLNREIVKVRRSLRATGLETMPDEMGLMAASEDDRRSRFEKGKPADPTENMSEGDAAKWKQKNDEHGDKFKKEGTASPAVLRALTRQLGMIVRDLATANAFTQYSFYNGVVDMLMTQVTLLKKMGEPDLARRMQTLVDALSERTIPLMHSTGWPIPDPELDKTASEENRARYEEGKPADPTENMDSEDAAKWKQNTEEHGDKFKEASDPLKTALARLSAAKKAVAAMPVSEAEKLASSAMNLYKEAHDLFEEAHRTKADYYDPIDPKLAARLGSLHGEVVKGLSILSRIDSKGAAPVLTKDLSTFGRMNLSPDTLSEAAGLAYVISNKALLVLHKARRAGQQVRFYTDWIAYYKATGSPPPLESQWEWLRTADAWKVKAAASKLAIRQYDNYSDELHKLQTEFTGLTGQAFAEWASAFHRQAGIDHVSWDWGYAVPKGKDAAEIRVWLKDTPILPVFRDVDPNFLINLTFDADGDVTIKATSGSFKLADRSLPAGKATPGYIGASLGESWERFLRGSPDFGYSDQRIRAPE